MVNETAANKKVKAKQNRDEWIVSIKETLAKVKKPSKLSIYKVPNKLVKLKKDAYTPSIVSIGPFHHRNKELQAFEEHKWRYTLHLISRTSKAAVPTLHECATAILDLEGEARRCYSEYIDFDEHKLAKILLVDGCFILELFLRHLDIENYKDEVVNPIINSASTVANLQHDLALLENQIPFVVLQTLFNIIKKNMPLPLPYSFTTNNNVVTLALLFFKSALDLTLNKQAVEIKSMNLNGDHLLDILHNFYFPTSDKSPEILDIFYLPTSDKIPEPRGLQSAFRDCATQLLKEGIQFEGDMAATEEKLLHIKFDGEVVKMPPLRIQEATESIFRNLIAFEQCKIGSSHYIASYVFLMRSLLRSSHDVELLEKKQIIRYDLSGGGGGEDVTSFFKSMCNGVVLKDSYFSKLCEDVNNNYYNRMSWWHWRRLFLIWRKLKATAKHKCREYMIVLHDVYFSNPWRIISFIGAFLLLFFTAMQTYYTYRTYYHHQ